MSAYSVASLDRMGQPIDVHIYSEEHPSIVSPVVARTQVLLAAPGEYSVAEKNLLLEIVRRARPVLEGHLGISPEARMYASILAHLAANHRDYGMSVSVPARRLG